MVGSFTKPIWPRITVAREDRKKNYGMNYKQASFETRKFWLYALGAKENIHMENWYSLLTQGLNAFFEIKTEGKAFMAESSN